jgi:hypothetical protein
MFYGDFGTVKPHRSPSFFVVGELRKTEKIMLTQLHNEISLGDPWFPSARLGLVLATCWRPVGCLAEGVGSRRPPLVRVGFRPCTGQILWHATRCVEALVACSLAARPAATGSNRRSAQGKQRLGWRSTWAERAGTGMNGRATGKQRATNGHQQACNERPTVSNGRGISCRRLFV